MQGHWHKNVDIIEKRACLQRGIRKPDHNRIKLGPVILERQNHLPQ
jgi:hypothetical protein